MLRLILLACRCASKVLKLTLFARMFYIPRAWSGPSLSNFGNLGIFTSARALVWSPFHRHPWSAFNSFSSVFLHPVCLTVSRNSWTFFSHSFRIGAATTATQCGIPDHLYKTLGRWSSDAYQLYVRTLVESILEVSGRLLQ